MTGGYVYDPPPLLTGRDWHGSWLVTCARCGRRSGGRLLSDAMRRAVRAHGPCSRPVEVAA